MDGLTVEDDDDMILIIALIALLVTIVAFVLLLPIALGDKREPARRRFWRFKWIYVVYIGIGIGLYAFIAMDFEPIYSGMMGSTLPALYLGTVLAMKQKGVSSVDLVPGGKKIAETAQPVGKDEFEVDMRVVDKSDTASRVPKLKKDESTLAVGASRSGKTSSLKYLACQIDYSEQAVFAHGSIDEYSEFYQRLGKEVVVIGVEDSTHRWNLFQDCRSDRDFEAISRSLFDDENSDYFERASRQVFAACLKLLDREQMSPNHGDIREMFQRTTASETYEKLKEHPDLRSAAEQIDPEAKEQQRGVWSSVVQRAGDVFVGDFGRSGSFSFREYVQNPDGRVVVVESPELSRGVGPGYSLLVDEMIDAGMENPQQECFYLLDELDTIPRLQNLKELASRGLKQNCRMLLGIQTIGQMRDVYGRNGTKGVTGNCNQIIGLSPGNDGGDTVEWYQSLLGERREMVKSRSRSRDQGTPIGGRNTRKSVSEQEKERSPITAHKMNQWDVGEGIIVARNQWWVGQLDYYERIIERYTEGKPKQKVTV